MPTTSNTTMTKLLIVDDDVRLRDLLKRYFTEQGFDVTTAEDGVDMNKSWQSSRFDLIILDLMMPGEDGLSICRRIRTSKDNTPIIILTAKNEEIEKIIGLEMGADDYVSKPFNPRELLARVNAILRRVANNDSTHLQPETEIISFGEYTLNLGTRTLSKHGVPIALTTGEFSVLKVFAKNPRVPLSRDKLMELARGREYEAFDRSLDVQISRLRKLIEIDPSKPKHIQTVWGLGYVFIPEGDQV